MSSCISPQQLERYHQDGILFPLEVLTEVEVQSFRSALEEFEQTFFAGPQKRISNLHLFFPWAFHLATHPRLLDTVEAILGDDILIDGTLVFGKLPHNPSYATWHQDSLYSGWHLTPSVSAWIALSDSTAENGCMRAIPGTHMQGVLPHTNIRDGANLLRRGEQVSAAIDEIASVDIILNAGQMSLHHCNVIHGSKPNQSSDRRIGFIVRFVTNHTRDSGRPLLRARGTGKCDRLKMAAPPNQDDAARAFAAWQQFNEQ